MDCESCDHAKLLISRSWVKANVRSNPKSCIQICDRFRNARRLPSGEIAKSWWERAGSDEAVVGSASVNCKRCLLASGRLTFDRENQPAAIPNKKIPQRAAIKINFLSL